MPLINQRLKINPTYIAFAILYLFFICKLINTTGVITTNEAEKYINAALSVHQGKLKEAVYSHLFYISYIFFVSIFYLTKNAVIVVTGQAALSFLSGICLKKITDDILGRSWYSYLSMAIFLFSFPIQSWTVTLYSESFFISILIITLFLTLKQKSSSETVLWICLNMILIFSRPPGIFLVLPNIAYYAIQLYRTSARSVLVAYVLTLTVTILTLFYLPAETKGYIRPIAAERIIVDSIDYTVPEFTSAPKSTIAQAYTYILLKKDIRQLFTLYIKKTASFFTLTRPYYSRKHNLLLLPYYTLYLLCPIGFYSLWKSDKKDVAFLLGSGIFGLTNLVALTYNEWHYRFTITIFPFLIIISTLAISYLLKAGVKIKNV